MSSTAARIFRLNAPLPEFAAQGHDHFVVEYTDVVRSGFWHNVTGGVVGTKTTEAVVHIHGVGLDGNRAVGQWSIAVPKIDVLDKGTVAEVAYKALVKQRDAIRSGHARMLGNGEGVPAVDVHSTHPGNAALARAIFALYRLRPASE